MEDKVANVYKEYKYLTWKIVLIMICLIIIMSMGVSIFLGSPFLHKETIDFILEHGNTSVAKEKAKILA